MRRYFLLILVATLLSVAPTFGQSLKATDYVYPLKDVAGYYSANFGEMRPNHFHAGTDFKTDGVEGKPVVSVADGYISRISLSPSGYGLALYVTHPNGTTSVYAHLSRFRDDIHKFVLSERRRQKRSQVDIYCSADRFPVKQGEQIASSGNTGSSFGPHLHFEIRQSSDQKTLNIIAQGIVSPKDDIAPYFMKLHYFEVDTIAGIPYHSKPTTYRVYKADNNLYRTEQRTPIRVGRKGYFVVETSDRKNDCANTFGVYNLSLDLDGEKIFEYRNDGFTFDLSRYCNAVSYYSIQRSSRNEVMRTALLQGTPKQFHPTVKNNGIITTSASQKRRVTLRATDDCKNTSLLSFEIEGKSDEECFKAEEDPTSRKVYYNRDFAEKVDDVFSAVIPKGALYESISMKMERSEIVPKADTTVKILSPAYTLHDDNTPLQKSIGIIFSQDVEPQLHRQTAVARVSSSGAVSYVGGNFRYNRIVARTTSFGTFCLVADLAAPVIQPSFKDGGDYRSSNSISFRVWDNFSGVASYDVWIDGEWTPVEFASNRSIINFKAEGIGGAKSHKILIKAVDACGNVASWEGTFVK